MRRTVRAHPVVRNLDMVRVPDRERDHHAAPVVIWVLIAGPGLCHSEPSTGADQAETGVITPSDLCLRRSEGVSTVGLSGFKLNPDLAVYLRERSEKIDNGKVPESVEPALTPIPQQRRLSARLSETDVASIVERYCSGATARSLAAEYGLGLTAMKGLLRKQGARKN